MNLQPVTTRICNPPKDDLTDIYRSIVPLLKEGMIVAISSKIIAIEEGRCVPVSEVADKDELIAKHSDLWLSRERTPGRWVMHTITDGVLIPSAGIDESNANDHYILWPENSNASAERICRLLRELSGIESLGVLVTDSHSTPLRRGVVGLAIGHWGFSPLTDYRGQKDIFERELKVSQANLPDGLAAAAVLAMGEGAEQTPIVLISDLPASVRFTHGDPAKGSRSTYVVPMEEDLYYPFLGSVDWKPGGNRADK